MKKKILLIRKGKSFMLNTIEKNLTDADYEVVQLTQIWRLLSTTKGKRNYLSCT